MTQAPQKSFADWLVASDIDGTLNNKKRKLPPQNLEAIRRFTAQLGGHFTLASGRSVPSMARHYLNLPLNNTPAIVLNGAGIYDFGKKEMLHFNAIDSAGMAFVEDLFHRFPLTELQVCTQEDNMIFMARPLFMGPAMLAADKLPHRNFRRFEQLPKQGWGKVIFFGLPPTIRKLAKYMESVTAPPVHCMSSSIVTHELLAPNTHKGTAVLKLAELLGVPTQHTAAIGDYFNDYDMLRSVAVPAVCGQAPDEMKEIAEFVACHCNQGAVASFLEYLERTYAD